MVEALIALLIFSLATLGIVGLQATMTRANTSAKFRADAAFLASDLVGTMWTDGANLASYASASCAGYTRCAHWITRLNARLPGATPTVVADSATGRVTISIAWTVPEEGTHTYATSTAIQLDL